MRSFADAAAMGTALDKGDIDMMTRTMSPAQIKKLSEAPGQHVDLIEMPGLEIRYLAFNTKAPVGEGQGRAPGDGAGHQPRRARSKVYGDAADPLYSHGPRHHHRPRQLLLQQVRRPNVAKAARPAAAARTSPPR